MQTDMNDVKQRFPADDYQRPLPGRSTAHDDALTPERLLMMAAGVMNYLISRSWFRGLALSVFGTVAVGMIIRAIARSRQRPRTWTEKLADKLGLDFDAREAEESIKQVRQEMNRLRREIEDRFEDSKAAELLRR